MEPLDLSRDDILDLPEDAKLVEFAKDQPQYRVLPTARLPGVEGRTISRWMFSDAERKVIAEGADLYVAQLTFGLRLQPINLSLKLEDLVPCPADRDVSHEDSEKAVSAAYDHGASKMQ